MPISYNPVRVAFFDHTVLLSGGEKSLVQLMAALDRTRYAPLLIVPKPGPLENAVRALNIPVCFLPFPDGLAKASRRLDFLRTPLHILGLWQVSRSLKAICVANKIQILHTNSLKAHVIGSFLNLPNLKLVWHVRDVLKPGVSRGMLRVLVKIYPHKIICISSLVAQQFGKTSKIEVVHNAVQLSRRPLSKASQRLLNQISASQKKHNTAKSFILACVGQIAFWKGQDIFIEAIRILRGRGVAVTGLIVGDVMFPEREKKFRDKLQRLLQKYQLTDVVFFTGYQSFVAPWLQLADLVVHCNREPEPFGRVLVEAMLANKVVITNSRVATWEVLAPSLRPLQVLPENPKALAEQIEKLLREPRQLKKLSRTLKPWAQKRFSDQKMIKAVQRIYQEVLR